MDRLEHYRHCIGELLNRYVQCWNEEGIETQLIVDTTHDQREFDGWNFLKEGLGRKLILFKHDERP